MSSQQTTGVVLYVEDEEGDTLFMEVAFKKAGLSSALRTVGDGREAMEYLSGKGAYADRGKNPVPAVVLLDLNLPVVSGFHVLEWMRGQRDYKEMPVVVFSSSSKQEDRNRALKLGANDFVEKPNSGLLFVRVAQKLKKDFLGEGASED